MPARLGPPSIGFGAVNHLASQNLTSDLGFKSGDGRIRGLNRFLNIAQTLALLIPIGMRLKSQFSKAALWRYASKRLGYVL